MCGSQQTIAPLLSTSCSTLTGMNSHQYFASSCEGGHKGKQKIQIPRCNRSRLRAGAHVFPSCQCVTHHVANNPLRKNEFTAIMARKKVTFAACLLNWDAKLSATVWVIASWK